MVRRQDDDAAIDTLNALRGEIATLRGARSVEDVREMLCEASCVDVTDERCARIWSLLEHPATTMTTLAVIADERGESYAKASATVASLRTRLAAAEGLLSEAQCCVDQCVELGWDFDLGERIAAFLTPAPATGSDSQEVRHG